MTDQNFRHKVEAIMAKVPVGQVTTYGDVAVYAGSPYAAQIVGSIAHYGDPELPWHRLVNRFGGMARGYHGGMEAQAQHLAAEGITCTEHLIDDFEAKRWRPQFPVL